MKAKKSKKVITLCSSASFFKDLFEIEKKLKALGFKVNLPLTAYKMKRTGNFNAQDYKTWFKNQDDYGIKTKLVKNHFKKIIESDAILVMNFEKHGTAGYIGGNVLMEMAIAFHYKKPIFIFDDISDDAPLKEEILGLESIFIERDLTRINF